MDEIASAIACGFPAGARGRARLVLAANILPWDLRGISSFADPRRLVEIAYASLVELLGGVIPEARLDELEAQARRRKSQQLLDRAVGVAVARWAYDNVSIVLPAPWSTVSDPFRDLDHNGYADEMARQLEVIDSLEVEADVRARRLMRSYLVLARFTLRVARDGLYAVASGPLLVFLRDMGVATRDVTLELQRPRTDRMARLNRAIAVPPLPAKRR
ncbi:MAG TPA: hypothetical protein VM261_06300 [Kofleriaceae bacterium]|nr:hypothetical protein [Kofleriaceae bacterium]